MKLNVKGQEMKWVDLAFNLVMLMIRIILVIQLTILIVECMPFIL